MNSNNSASVKMPEKKFVKYQYNFFKVEPTPTTESYICAAKKKVPRCWESVLTQAEGSDMWHECFHQITLLLPLL